MNARKYKLNFCSQISAAYEVLHLLSNILHHTNEQNCAIFSSMAYLSYEMTSNTLVDRIFVGLVGCMTMDSINLLFIASGMTSQSW